LKESPIGNGDKYSCFTVIVSKIKYKGIIEFLNCKRSKSTCIEAFSDNKKKPIKIQKPYTKHHIKNGKTHEIRKFKKN